jgi:hypothetical protein
MSLCATFSGLDWTLKNRGTGACLFKGTGADILNGDFLGALLKLQQNKLVCNLHETKTTLEQAMEKGWHASKYFY